MSILRLCHTTFCAAMASLLGAQEGVVPPEKAKFVEAAAQPKTPAGLVVGVVDLDKAMEFYPKALAERERLQKLKDLYDDQIQQRSKRIDELKQTIPAIKEGTRERAQKQLEYEMAMQERQSFVKLCEADLQVEDMRVLLAVYEDIEVVLAQLAKDRGVHVVLRLDRQAAKDAEGDEKLSPRQVQRRLEVFDRRKVWFAAEELDLTAALVKMLQVPLDQPKVDAPPAPQGAGKDGK